MSALYQMKPRTIHSIGHGYSTRMSQSLLERAQWWASDDYIEMDNFNWTEDEMVAVNFECDIWRNGELPADAPHFEQWVYFCLLISEAIKS